MGRITAFFLFCTFLSQVAAQERTKCSVYLGQAPSYQHPLYDPWLSGYDVKHYDLFLTVSNKNTEISGEAVLLLEAKRKLDTVVLELQGGLTVSEVSASPQVSPFASDRKLNFAHEGDVLFVQLDRTCRAGELLCLKVVYSGEAGQNRGFFAGIHHKTDPSYGFEVTYTLSEPLHASDWFPAKQVLEDKIDSVTFRIRCGKSLMAASNGVLKGVESLGRDRIYTWQTHYPMAYYLLSFAVAEYQEFSFMAGLSGAGDSVQVQNFIYDSKAVLSDWEKEIRASGAMLSLFSRLLVDYPFAEEKYGHAMAPVGGGIEHQTMTTLDNFNFYLVAHELAHQWFGDHVTCGNWQDIWINEGFASYMEYVAAQQLRDQDAADAWLSSAMSVALGETKGSVYVPEEEVENVQRLFDFGLSYKKGAILLHMIRSILDEDDLFFSILRAYLQRHGNGHATGEDFRSLLESESGLDFSAFFQQWYYGEGYPRFELQWMQQADTLIILSKQTGSAPEHTPLFQVPFTLELRFPDRMQERIRLRQDRSVEEFRIPVQGLVEELIFDPEMHLLKTVRVSREEIHEPVPVSGMPQAGQPGQSLESSKKTYLP